MSPAARGRRLLCRVSWKKTTQSFKVDFHHSCGYPTSLLLSGGLNESPLEPRREATQR